MTTGLQMPESALRRKLVHGFFEDFDHLVSADRWTSVDGDSGASATVGDTRGGVLDLVTGATDNNEAYVHTTAELFKFVDNKPIVWGARLKYSEANTDDANVIVGMVEGAGADTLVDDGGGPPADYDGFVLFKEDGETDWMAEVSAGTTQKNKRTNSTAANTNFVWIEAEFNPITSTEAVFAFWVDGKQVEDTDGDKFTLRLDYSSTNEFAFVVGVKAGGGNSETLNVDAGYAYQKR